MGVGIGGGGVEKRREKLSNHDLPDCPHSPRVSHLLLFFSPFHLLASVCPSLPDVCLSDRPSGPD